MKGLLPESILNRPKMGFPVPFAGWTRGPWNGVARDVLLDRRSRERGLHRSGRGRARCCATTPRAAPTAAIASGACMNLELWHRTFIDGDGVQTLPAPSSPATYPQPAGAGLASSGEAA